MIKKILPISIFVLVFVSILLIWFQSTLNKGGSGNSSLTPTIVPGKQGSGYTPLTGKTTGGNAVKQLSPEELKKKLPIIAPDFTLDYSPRMQRYVVTETGEGAANSYNDWIEQNPAAANELQGAVVTKQTVEELNAVLDNAKKNQQTPEEKAVEKATAFTSTFKMLNSLPYILMNIPTPQSSLNPTTPPKAPSPTESMSPTPNETQPTKATSPTASPTIPSGSTSNILPNPLPAISSKALSFKQSIGPCISNKSLYEVASSKTGIQWEILAAIHYNEGGCGQNSSLVSGRAIGTNEPDIVRGGGCSSGVSGEGIPYPLPGGGCGFKTLLDSAIYAGNHIKGKIGKVPSNFQELAKAFTRYNGGGNSNCGKTPYTNCPRLYEGEDDPYVMNFFDSKHETMYLVYCADLTKCNPPRSYVRPGAGTIIRLVTNQI